MGWRQNLAVLSYVLLLFFSVRQFHFVEILSYITLNYAKFSFHLYAHVNMNKTSCSQVISGLHSDPHSNSKMMH